MAEKSFIFYATKSQCRELVASVKNVQGSGGITPGILSVENRWTLTGQVQNPAGLSERKGLPVPVNSMRYRRLGMGT